MTDRLQDALQEAIEQEYAWVPAPENLDYNYTFSPAFTRKMERLRRTMRQNEHAIEERTYVHVGGRRVRRALLVALIAALIMAMTAGAIAIQRALVHWNETQNDEAGTLDITFDVDDPNDLTEEFHYKKPKTPDGYEIVREETYSDTEYEIEYHNDDGQIILYIQSGSIEKMGFGIDNEDAEFHEVEINGYKGYSYSKLGNHALTWTDGMALYDIIGTCEMEVLWAMAKSLA